MERLSKVVQRVVFGDPEEVLEVLCGNNSDDKINTSYVERLNLTIRNSLARFIRRTMNESKDQRDAFKSFWILYRHGIIL
ncbi:MAG: hypothetical protein MASP_00052 [Candidatus Methanolliviera sp. GoM_asphalt]|nr:MAG: hypothetical protein MASP_00052 [Candidatus Methanolliviera sp. GoM_asphalt]